MTIVAFLILAAVLVSIPQWGALAQFRRWSANRRRERLEDALKVLLGCSHRGHTGSTEVIAGTLGISGKDAVLLVERMVRKGLVQSTAGGLVLTPEGEGWALQVVRAHRLLERYLADEARMPLTRLHNTAEKAEHRLPASKLDELEAQLGHPERDPHGDPIPQADGSLPPDRSVPLTDWPTGTKAHIVHIEDEPDTIFSQIVAIGLRLGHPVRILENHPDYIVLSDGEQEHRLAPIVAANIFVREAQLVPVRPEGAVALSELPEDTPARVVGIDPNFRGFARRRLLDLGLTPAARVSVALPNAFGDPRGYKVRETVIALREAEARKVWVQVETADKAVSAGAMT